MNLKLKLIKMSLVFRIAPALTFFVLMTHFAYACNTSMAFTSTVTLQGGNFSAGQDMAPGTILRVQRVNANSYQNPQCIGSSTLNYITEGGTPYPGATNIYQTGVDGLGVRFRSLRWSSGLYYGNGSAAFSGTALAPSFSFEMEFIVMGPISGGAVNSSAFPTLKVYARDGYGSWDNLATYNFSGGSFSVQTPTCTTPNYDYNLGTYGLSNFSGGTKVSPWMDTPIKLSGCATFYGNNSNGSYTDTNQTGQSPALRGTIAPNTLTVSLKPNTSIIDSKNGIVSLNSTSTATGVAIQVGNGQSGLYTPLDLDSGIVLTTTPGSTTTSYTFPVGARIVRSTGDLAPGSVSSSFVYTVTYK